MRLPQVCGSLLVKWSSENEWAGAYDQALGATKHVADCIT